jgi:hypothetical protein
VKCKESACLVLCAYKTGWVRKATPPPEKRKEIQWRISCLEEEQDLLFGRAKGKALHEGLRIINAFFSSK